jgi:ABC-type transporter Mla subunit MlaD
VDAPDDPTGLLLAGGAAGLGAQLDEWAAELDAWAQRRRGLVELLEVVTRDLADQPRGEQLAALNGQLRAVLDQLRAMGEQVRAVRQQLAALHAAPGAPP